jgi:hypothetical protein
MSDFEWTYDIECHEHKVGDIVTVPVSSTGRSLAIIDSPLYDGYYRIKGPNPGESWGRWVRHESIRLTKYTCECEIGFVVRKHRPKCNYMIETFGR